MTSQESDESQITSEKPEEITSEKEITEKPLFVCDICGKSFTSENSLKAHRLKAHRIRADWRSKEGGEVFIPKSERDELSSLKAEVTRLRLEREKLLRQLELYETERSFYRRRYGFDPFVEEKARKQTEMIMADPLVRLEYARLLQAYRERLEKENSSSPTNLAPTPQIGAVSTENEEIKALREEIKELKTKLEEEREKRREEQLKKLEQAIDELRLNTSKVANQFSAIETAIRELGDIVKTYLNLGKIVLEKKPEKPPVREKVGGESIIYDLLPNELIIEEKEEE